MIDSLTIVSNGRELRGWTDVRLTRGIERMPADFEVNATQKDLSGNTTIINAFDPIQVYLGADLVLTGYVDTVQHSISSSSHDISISGRSKCADLVDCSAEFSTEDSSGLPGVPLLVQHNKNVLALARELAAPYGISVSLQSSRFAVNVPLLQVNIGETAYEIIERFARSQNLLVYDGTDGNLILADVGNSEMSSGFSLGANIEALSYEQSYHGRFSVINVFDQSVSSQGTLGLNTEFGTQIDPSIRHRRLMLFSETPFISTVVWTQQRANWEMNRRVGRSKVIRVTTDSWRDGSKKLWQPNSFVTLNAPTFGLVNLRWVISEVSYAKNLESGTTASLVLMSEQAFSIEPTNLFPSDAALVGNGPAVDAPPDVVGGF